jgi:acetyl esterase/lipase
VASEAFETVVAFLRAADLLADVRDPQQLRAAMAQGSGLVPLPADIEVEPVVVNGVPAEWVRAPDATRDAALLYLHGGGYVIGSPASHRNLCAALARHLGVPVLSLDYRLAPEHPHPAAVDDATAAYRFLLDAGFASGRLAIAGDSAGGGLALAALVKLRDGGVPLPAAAVPISPWVDIAMTGDTMRTLADTDPMVRPDGLARMAAWFLAGADARDPYASPLYADLAGLPPVLIHVGEVETLLDDSRRMHERLVAAGVESTLEIFPEMVHVFHVFCGVVPESDAAVAAVADFLRKHLHV